MSVISIVQNSIVLMVWYVSQFPQILSVVDIHVMTYILCTYLFVPMERPVGPWTVI